MERTPRARSLEICAPFMGFRRAVSFINYHAPLDLLFPAGKTSNPSDSMNSPDLHLHLRLMSGKVRLNQLAQLLSQVQSLQESTCPLQNTRLRARPLPLQPFTLHNSHLFLRKDHKQLGIAPVRAVTGRSNGPVIDLSLNSGGATLPWGSSRALAAYKYYSSCQNGSCRLV
jgi:hypothetical protein